jgi:hypothetical protein
MRPTFCGISLLYLTLCLVPATALAETGQKSEALRHYELGLAHVQNKIYGEAIAEFNQAYDLGRDFAVLYDIGQAYLAIDEPARAVKVLQRYLGEGGKHVPNARRKEVEDEIAKQQERIATVIVRAKFPGAVIKVDGVEVGKTPLAEGLQLNAGVHVVTASAQGYRPWEQRLELAGGDRRNLEVALEPGASVAAGGSRSSATDSTGSAEQAQPFTAGATDTEAARPGSGPFPPRKTVAFALGGLGAGALVVGAVFGVRALSKRNDSDA